MDESWVIRHFSQANPAGPGQGDVSALLRSVAETLETIEGIDIQDLILGTEMTEDGPWHHLTVYYYLPGDSAETDE